MSSLMTYLPNRRWFCRSGTIVDEVLLIPINVKFLAEELLWVRGAILDDINDNEKEA